MGYSISIGFGFVRKDSCHDRHRLMLAPNTKVPCFQRVYLITSKEPNKGADSQQRDRFIVLLLSSKRCGRSYKLNIKRRGFIDPVKFFVNTEVRFAKKVLKRRRVGE